MELAAVPLRLGLATPQVLDLLFAVVSLALFVGYHAWYYRSNCELAGRRQQ